MNKVTVPILLLIFLNGCQPNGNYSNEYNVQLSYPAPYISSEKKQKYLNAINSIRSQKRYCGNNLMQPAPAVKWNTALYKAAYEHVNDLSRHDYIDYIGSGKRSDWSGLERGGKRSMPIDRALMNGYNPRYIDDISVGGANKNSIDNVLSYALTDTNICKELMSTNYNEVGVAKIRVPSTSYKNFWSIMLGKRK